VGEREYVLLLHAATKAQDAARARQVLAALAEDVLRPSRRHTWPALEAWFASPAAAAPTDHPRLGPWTTRRTPAKWTEPEPKPKPKPKPELEPEPERTQVGEWRPGDEWHPPAAAEAAAAREAAVDGVSGRCGATGLVLRSVELSHAAQVLASFGLFREWVLGTVSCLSSTFALL
jgi:hypothetical protein